jgi:hypothetical protein
MEKFRTPKKDNSMHVILSNKRKNLLMAIREARTAYRRLYQAITTLTDCDCHSFGIELSPNMFQDNSIPVESLYRLLISPISDTKSFTHLIVRPEKFKPVLSNCKSAILPTTAAVPWQIRRIMCFRRERESRLQQFVRAE